MSTPRNTLTTTADPIDRPPVADRVAAATDDYNRQFHALAATRPGTDAERAERAQRLSMICARTAGWWRVLATHCDPGVHAVFRLAAVAAECQERDRARFWRDLAADWQARAEQRPTSDAAGALSNWAELGVTT
ncbi:hypothetical protein [Pseudonocardia sp. 73-21]|uniref:hypothetical protein n=1 Tax=Pseudonocardia sp. 73-21 TaxID=1895809 RepID=UPI000959AD1A|nr:hypothetical protein [Pseudonocardia sp. 73-21]OJY49534.1 MAG: hypothetical protein BGP03_13575 [Pseudonocardia sp. 73-21]